MDALPLLRPAIHPSSARLPASVRTRVPTFYDADLPLGRAGHHSSARCTEVCALGADGAALDRSELPLAITLKLPAAAGRMCVGALLVGLGYLVCPCATGAVVEWEVCATDSGLALRGYRRGLLYAQCEDYGAIRGIGVVEAEPRAARLTATCSDGAELPLESVGQGVEPRLSPQQRHLRHAFAREVQLLAAVQATG